MVYRGTIKSGSVVLPAHVTPPEGTEVLVALPDHRAGSETAPPTWEIWTELGHRARTSPTDLPPDLATNPAQYADHPAGQDGPAEEPQSYPVEDFLSPTEYVWNEDICAAEVAVRAYLRS